MVQIAFQDLSAQYTAAFSFLSASLDIEFKIVWERSTFCPNFTDGTRDYEKSLYRELLLDVTLN